LLKKAKDKLLFLAFCIEYKRYNEFLVNEDIIEFKTYLPIQLDATCNGFQHMALLSNESTLFEELNLVKSKQGNKPKDFYNFLLHKVLALIDSYVRGEIPVDVNKLENYKRLNDFI